MMPFLDDAQTTAFKYQLAEIDGELYNVKYGKLECLELVSPRPMDPGAESYIYRQWDGRAIAKMSSNYSNGSPRADVSVKEFTANVFSIRSAFGISIQEIRSAAKAGTPLEPMRAMRCRRAIDELLNDTALTGNAELGLTGLFNVPSANSVTPPSDGTSSSPLWANKTGELMIRDLLLLVDKAPTVTNEIEKPKRVLLPYVEFRRALGTRMSVTSGAATDRTVIEQFKILRPGIEIRGALLLNTASGSGANRAVAYDPDRTNLEWLLAVPFESFAPQLSGMEYVVECHARCGGVVCRYPLTVTYMDGI